MDIEATAKKELIDHIISTMVDPNVKLVAQSDEDEAKLVDFISDAKLNKKVSAKLPIEFALRSEMFNLIKTGKIFIDGSIKFIATFTTERPVNCSCSSFEATYRGNEFKYSFLDNHAGIINVDNVKDIPIDYEGLMAVPITVLNYRNITRFNIYRVIYTPRFCGKYIYPRVVVSNKYSVTD
jgi:hypothetical protein